MLGLRIFEKKKSKENNAQYEKKTPELEKIVTNPVEDNHPSEMQKEEIPFEVQKEDVPSELEISLGNARTNLVQEECRTLSILNLAYRLEQRPFDYKDEKGRVRPKKYLSAYNSIKLLSDKFTESGRNLKNIALEYSRLKRELRNHEDEPANEQTLGIKSEIKEKLISAYRSLKQSKTLIDNAGHEFFLNNYELIKENGFELHLHKRRSKAFKPAAIAALSILIGGAGLTGLYKAKIIHPFNQKPGLEQKVEQAYEPPVYERINFSENEDAAFVSGKVPILMYHKIGTPEDRFTVSSENFKNHLQKLYEHDFQLISAEEYLKQDFSSLKPGKKPAVITFDDADEGQFRFATYNNKLVFDEFGNPVIDPDCAIGILMDFYSKRPDFGKKASFFIDFVDQYHKEEAPFIQESLVKLKLNYLLKEGFEVCKHTYSHPDMRRGSINDVKKEEARLRTALEYYLGDKAILVKNIFAYPYGSIPEDKEVIEYVNQTYDGAFAGWGGLAESSQASSNITPPPRVEISTNLDRDVLSKNDFLQKNHYRTGGRGD